MRAWIWAAVVSMAACYRPTLPAGQYQCASDADCPDHLRCGGGICVDPAQVDLLAGRDQGRPDDLRNSQDQRPGDPGDLGVDLAPAAPCAAGWIELSPPNIYACKRAFTVTAGDFSGLCEPGYHVCGKDDAVEKIMGAVAGQCAMAGGFFTTQIEVAMKTANMAECNPANFGAQPRALLGCGSDLNTVALANDCQKLKAALVCTNPAPTWSCTSGKDPVHTTNTQGGLLCCKDL